MGFFFFNSRMKNQSTRQLLVNRSVHRKKMPYFYELYHRSSVPGPDEILIVTCDYGTDLFVVIVG